jgi:hypothetical protein
MSFHQTPALMIKNKKHNLIRMHIIKSFRCHTRFTILFLIFVAIGSTFFGDEGCGSVSKVQHFRISDKGTFEKNYSVNNMLDRTAMRWKPSNGMHVMSTNNLVIKVSGTQANDRNYATMTMPFDKFQPGVTYRLNGLMKVESLSDSRFAPMLKLVVSGRTGNYIRDWPTFVYSIHRIKTWQKLWMEVTADDRFDHGFVALDKGATNKALSANLYIRDVTLTKIKNPTTFSPSISMTDEKLNSGFWPFKKSDVIAWVPGTTDDYRDYGVSFVSWGGRPEPDSKSMAEYCNTIQRAFQMGTKLGTNIGFKTGFAGFIKTSKDADVLSAQTKDLKGNPYIVKEMVNFKTRGFPAYWFSINNQNFLDYQQTSVEKSMQCKPYGLVVDDVLGDAAMVLWGSGEYSDNSVAGFRNYMKSNYTPKQLSSNGIDDIKTFDIRKYHQDYLSVPPDRRPFRDDIINFQLATSAEAFRKIKSSAITALGQRIPVGANISPASLWAGRLLLEMDYFSFECHMNPQSGKPDSEESVLSYKIADALKRPAVLMGTGEDHAFIQDNHLPGLIRYWIAEAYAFGNYFMAPYQLWAYNTSRGSYSYRPSNNKELAPLLQFIRKRAHLFDDYSVDTSTALVMSYTSYVQGRTNIGGIVKELIGQNIPFDIVIAGNDILDLPLISSQLRPYDTLIIPEGSVFSSNDASVLRALKQKGKRIVKTGDDKKLCHLVINGAVDVQATLRTDTHEFQPLILHMLNSDYNIKTDTYNGKKNFSIVIPISLLKGRHIQGVKYIRPPSWNTGSSEPVIYEDTKLDFSITNESVTIRVPFLDIWGILELS